MPEKRYRAIDRRKEFLINHNENETHRPGIWCQSMMDFFAMVEKKQTPLF
jgi:adenine-specific DNA glycosylase